jgi:hypothetical protein
MTYTFETFAENYHLDLFDADFSSWIVVVPMRLGEDIIECQVPPVIPQEA